MDLRVRESERWLMGVMDFVANWGCRFCWEVMDLFIGMLSDS